jgi:hypothetical protein
MKKTPYEFDGRCGSVSFINDSLYPVNLYLVHPDSGEPYPAGDTPFTTDGRSSNTLTLNGDKLWLGSDWGVRLGSSPVKGLGAVSTWDPKNHVFTITIDSYFKE